MRKLTITFFLLIVATLANACDFCNCYVGINPLFRKSFIGIRSQFSFYTGTHHDATELAEAELSKDDFKETRVVHELHGQFNLIPKLNMVITVPFIMNSESVSKQIFEDEHSHSHSIGESHESINGLGDPVIMSEYILLSHDANDSSLFTDRLFFGAGIKLPVGKYKIDSDEEQVERIHQPGTGSVDYLLNMTYLVKRKSIGLNINGNYMINTKNNQSFRFGNRMNGKTMLFYEKRLKNVFLFPQIGSAVEIAGMDTYISDKLNSTGGTIVHAVAGLDAYFKKLSLNCELQLPFIQNLNGTQPEMDYRIVAGLSYSFN